MLARVRQGTHPCMAGLPPLQRLKHPRQAVLAVAIRYPSALLRACGRGGGGGGGGDCGCDGE